MWKARPTWTVAGPASRIPRGGGWLERFAEYARIVFEALHDRVGSWPTHAIHHINLSHGMAVRAVDPRPRQGAVINLVVASNGLGGAV